MDEDDDERQGNFKRADLYKMHAYRDAIDSARTAWVLYPGSEFWFYGVDGNTVRSANGLSGLQGVGVIPLAASGVGSELLDVVRVLVQSASRAAGTTTGSAPAARNPEAATGCPTNAANENSEAIGANC